MLQAPTLKPLPAELAPILDAFVLGEYAYKPTQAGPAKPPIAYTVPILTWAYNLGWREADYLWRETRGNR